ncbi:protocatechuate 3,4-dioxygenase subunit alpha [Tritonibacter mobilis]|uniref:protocatechuate 3,4-dioxygenase subunit alpha n=1 Tax=Tritonibacter mobilis TaxID=379347 RepID=UPI001C0908D3|nr:protocatechuate 3,4-dioxygenase subunit alpha [Tritonibacter mobilis]MBU3034312.1 protocatechuate 3,4-dioxygenase subunit alpha [Tritonibacter mobilis]WHQ81670.1 protocatechuate 3,4-dioxygenase subunit alpha [Tritonibacter mobilis]
MVQPLSYLKESPSQTAGPYVHIGCTPNFAEIEGIYPQDLGHAMITGDVQGQRIRITGRVIDGTGTPLRDAMIEIWQPDAAGLFNSPVETRGTADPNFTGWGRCASDMTTGEFAFDTVKPGAVPFVDGRMQAPHVTLWIVARGINLGLHTRMYFPDEAEANADDPILSRIEHQTRVKTLIGADKGDGHIHFDIRLQGHNETVFFDI